MAASHGVAIVVDDRLAPEVESLARRCHVWAVRTPSMEDVAQRVWTEPTEHESDPLGTGLTLFNADATPQESLLSILEAVELHHGEYSHDPAVTTIEVMGVDATDALRQAFATLGFTEIHASKDGFIAQRRTT
jgi:hypothetical protein